MTEPTNPTDGDVVEPVGQDPSNTPIEELTAPAEPGDTIVEQIKDVDTVVAPQPGVEQ